MSRLLLARSLQRPAAAAIYASSPARIPSPNVAAVSLARPAVSHFSTSTPLGALPYESIRTSKRDPGANAAKRAAQKKQALAKTKARRPAPGARKAFRRRVQWSNESAIPVPPQEKLQADTLALESMECRMVELPGGVVDKLQILEAFKPTQRWGLFRMPHVLVRSETRRVAGMLNEAAEKRSLARLVLTGKPVTGKTVLLLQAMAHALANKWVVISIPAGYDLINGNTEYSPIPDTNPMQFAQPVYTTKLLEAIVSANETVLKGLFTSQTFQYESVHIPKDTSLAEMALSVREMDSAWPVFKGFWEELTRVPGRPPVLFALDGLAHLMLPSDYRDPSFNVVHAHDLALPRLFVDALAGRDQPFVNGGAVIATTGGNNSPKNVSLEIGLRQSEAAFLGKEIPPRDPWERKYDQRVLDVFDGTDVGVMNVEGVTKEEARTVMQYWAQSGLLPLKVTEGTVTEKWAVSGKGVLGELEKASLDNFKM